MIDRCAKRHSVPSLRIAGIVEDSIVDGPGLRLAVFAQGCPHGCPGCHNPHTHDPFGGYEESVDAILARAKANPLLSGITLTGGEPFAQPSACAALARGAREAGLSIVTFSGYVFEELLSMPEAKDLLKATDILVDGRYVEALRSLDLRFRGSSNQRILDCQASLKTKSPVLADI